MVLAHNEEAVLPRTLNILRAFRGRGLLHDIVVVNDGSTDATATIAKKGGAEVITHEKNKGKRGGFVSAAFAAKERKADVLVLLDADIIRLPERTLKNMISSVTTGKYLMATAQQFEKNDLHGRYITRQGAFGSVQEISSNAQRAFNLKGLAPLYKGNKKWLQYLSGTFDRAEHPGDKKWGLEKALEVLFPKNKKIWLHKMASPKNSFRPMPQATLQDAVYTREAFRRMGGIQKKVLMPNEPDISSQQGYGKAIIERIQNSRTFQARAFEKKRKERRIQRK